MAALSRFSDGVSEDLNAFVQKAISEKTKIARKYDLKHLKVRKKRILKYQFDSLNGGIDASINCLNKFNNCLSKKHCCSFVSS